MANHTPRPLQLATLATTPTPTNDAFSLPSPPSSFRHPKRFSDTMPTRNPLRSPSITAETKAARRQSSIGYFSPDSVKTPIRGSPERRISLGALQEGLVSNGSREDSWTRKGDRTSTVSLPVASASTPGLSNTPNRERPPLTLTEKHADLLRFIAQKESKCLELKSQLAVHEAELVQLKRKWERIVNRGLERDLHSATTNSSDPSSAVLEGIREGMSRLLAAGFSTSAPAPAPYASSTTIPKTSRSRPHSLIYKTHFTEESNSSISTFATTRSTARSSQSSMSSCDEIVKGGVEERERDNNSNSGSDDFKNQILMQNRQSQHKNLCLRPKSLPQQKENLLSEGEKWSSDVQPTTSKVHRRKSHEVARTLDFEHLDFSSLSPSVMLYPASESRKSASPENSPPLGRSSTSPHLGHDTNGVSGASSRSNSGVGLAPMSLIPGLGMTTGATTPAVGSWMDTVGKQWDKLQKSSTFTKNQKRASVLLADMSSSIANVLTPPNSGANESMANGTRHVSSDTNTSIGGNSTLKLPVTASPNPSSSGSLLDDDDDETARLGAAVLQPVIPHSPTIPQTNKPSLGEAKGDFDSDEEWGW
ncbi:hypothetical protein Agabi119p4_9360 [Agaricus bisporus var. burnettii]|uniref:Uncharacterized protein n=1 Tax=Agaricus bisporus var. burnettii TaxID=192524 RepID=A0A8H7C390_AGABI|nr:hypothetical protein Agabi119p4_9360 [Agaricus bisporus var. burnettii]